MPNKYTNTVKLVKNQYNTSKNLESRANLHAIYSTSTVSWFRWLFEHYDLQAGQRVLVCGGGPGWVWYSNLDLVPTGVELVFTDVSSGMVAEAEERLKSAEFSITCHTMDILDIPYADNSFDLVTANHMLYHVPDLPKAIEELRRIVKPTGKVIASTVGDNHMIELHTFRSHLLAVEENRAPITQMSFRLENGHTLLGKQFASVTVHCFDDALAVTEFEPLLAYVMSSTIYAVSDSTESIIAARNHFNKIVSQSGAYSIQKAVGIFIAYPTA